MSVRAPLLVLSALASLSLLAAACSSEDEEPNAVTIEGSDFAFEVTDGELTPGINTLTFRNSGTVDHHVQLVRLEGGKTFDELLPALEQGIPSWIFPAGGVAPVSPDVEGSVTLDLRPGQYALLCFLEEPEGRPHFVDGMAAAITVEGDEVVAEVPETEVRITGRDYAFDVPASVEAGEVTFRFTNAGADLHEVGLVRMPDGSQATNEELIAFFAGEGPPPFEGAPRERRRACRASSPARARSRRSTSRPEPTCSCASFRTRRASRTRCSGW